MMPNKDAPEPKTITPNTDTKIDAAFDEAVESLSKTVRMGNFLFNLDCGLGNHDFKPYRPGTMKCSKCGKFAKVGYMTREETEK